MSKQINGQPYSRMNLHFTIQSHADFRQQRLHDLLEQLHTRIVQKIASLEDSDGILTVRWESFPGERDILTINGVWDHVFGQGKESVRHTFI